MKIRFAISPHGGSLSAAGLPAFVAAIEDSGFDGIWLSDLPVSPVLDPLLGLALAAGRTTRLRLGANIVPLGHNPYLLAKQLAQLDQLSAGRLLLSFVTGVGRRAERVALELGDAGRGDLLEQSLAMMRAWWSGAAVEHPSFAGLAPPAQPVQDPLEVWLGGRGPLALERVGRVADGWLGALVTPAESGAARAAIDAAAGRAGRRIDPEHFGMSIAYTRATPAAATLDAVTGRRADVDPLDVVAVGEAGLRSLVKRYVAAGLSKFVVRPAVPVDDWAAEARWLAGAILPLQTA